MRVLAFDRIKPWLLFGLIVAFLSGCGPQNPRISERSLYRDVEPIKLEIAPTEGTEESRRVLIVCNIDSGDSIALTEYYARKRNVPPEHVVQIQVPTTEEVQMSVYEADIERPIREAIAKLEHRIDFIVLTKGIPFRVNDSFGYSVDSLLVGMKKSGEMMPANMPPGGEYLRNHANPYFNSEEPFNSSKFGIYLVTRLDGYTVEDAKRMVERSIKAKAERGPFVFDLAHNRTDNPDQSESSGWHQNRMMDAAADLENRGFDVVIEDAGVIRQMDERGNTRDIYLAPKERLMGYVTWGSNDAAFDLDRYRSIQFLSGAIAETYVSTSARTLIPTDEGQSLVGDLIEQGVTGVKGYVSEPWTIALARVDVLFDRYTRGSNLAESFYAASQLIRWKDVVFGDPLCRPFASGQAPARARNSARSSQEEAPVEQSDNRENSDAPAEEGGQLPSAEDLVGAGL